MNPMTQYISTMETLHDKYLWHLENLRVCMRHLFPIGFTDSEVALFEHFREIRNQAMFNRRQTMRFLERTGGAQKDICLNAFAENINN
jgi:hypothetical protein